MKLIKLSLAGALVQAICLALFVLVSRTRVATIGKPVVIGIAIAGIVYIIWRAATKLGNWPSLCLFPVLLGLGYIIAFNLVVAGGFRGLLQQVYAPDWDYFWMEIDIACLLTALYGIITALLFTVHKVLQRRTHSGA
jgi:hypothetical protein